MKPLQEKGHVEVTKEQNEAITKHISHGAKKSK